MPERLALRLFQEDVKQVLDWLEKHGEVFLRKNIGIGRNLQKARAYQKSHETFEGVVQVGRYIIEPWGEVSLLLLNITIVICSLTNVVLLITAYVLKLKLTESSCDGNHTYFPTFLILRLGISYKARAK